MAFIGAIINVFVFLVLRTVLCNIVNCKHDDKCFVTPYPYPPVTWQEAEEYCEKNFPNGGLASIHDAFDNSLVATLLPSLSSNPWIGGIRFGNRPFSWTDGTDFSRYTNWASGQPSKDCTQVCRITTVAGSPCQQGKWTTAECSSVSQFICEYGNVIEATTTPPPVPNCPSQWTYFPGKNSCYRYYNSLKTWTDAESACNAIFWHGRIAHLVSIHDADENDMVAALVDRDWNTTCNYANGFEWIGMHEINSTSKYYWTDSTNTEYFNWGYGQPDHGHAPPGQSTEQCVQINSRRHEECGSNGQPLLFGQWNDETCAAQLAYVCKVSSFTA